MEMSGSPTSRRHGRRIRQAAGFGSLTTVGHGFPMSLGAGRRITTGAGSFTEEIGAGGQGRSMAGTGQYGLRRLSFLLVSGPGRVSLSAFATLACFPWARMITSIHGMGAALTA